MSKKINPPTREQIEKACRDWFDDHIERLKRQEGEVWKNPDSTDEDKLIAYAQLAEAANAEMKLQHFINYPPYLKLYIGSVMAWNYLELHTRRGKDAYNEIEARKRELLAIEMSIWDLVNP